MKTKRAVFLLLILAPICGEVMSSSQPPLEFFQPVNIVLQMSLYGCGALLVREIVRRWNQGWLSIFLLGLAYGIYEEGIVVRSFFDPTWQDLGILAAYGRWIGVNWVWSVWLSIFHAAISITVPVVLVELVFPKLANKLWLRNRGLVLAVIPFLAISAIGPLMGMEAGFLAIAGSIVVMLALALAAYYVPKGNLEEARDRVPVKPGRIVLTAFLLTFGVVLNFFLLPELGAPVLVTIGTGIGLVVLAVVLCRRAGVSAWGEIHRWSAVFGVLIPWWLLDLITELDNANRPDNTSGMALFVLTAFILMIVLRVFIRRRDSDTKAVEDSAVEGMLPDSIR